MRRPLLATLALLYVLPLSGCLNIPQGQPQLIDHAQLDTTDDIICEESGGPGVFAIGSTAEYSRWLSIEDVDKLEPVRHRLLDTGFFVPDGSTDADELRNADNLLVGIRAVEDETRWEGQ